MPCQPSRLQPWCYPNPQKTAGSSEDTPGPPELHRTGNSSLRSVCSCSQNTVWGILCSGKLRAPVEGKQHGEEEVRRAAGCRGLPAGGRPGICGARSAGHPERLCPGRPRPPPRLLGHVQSWAAGCALCSWDSADTAACLHGAAAAPSPARPPVHHDADTMFGNRCQTLCMSTSVVIYSPARWMEAQGWPRITHVSSSEGVWSDSAPARPTATSPRDSDRTPVWFSNCTAVMHPHPAGSGEHRGAWLPAGENFTVSLQEGQGPAALGHSVG